MYGVFLYQKGWVCTPPLNPPLMMRCESDLLMILLTICVLICKNLRLQVTWSDNLLK